MKIPHTLMILVVLTLILGNVTEVQGDTSNPGTEITSHFLAPTNTTSDFPYIGPPAYDSGWTVIDYGNFQNFNHSLGGDPDDYVVDLQARTEGGTSHNYFFGGDIVTDVGEPDNPKFFGFSWYYLGDTYVTVWREEHEWLISEEFRVRIWVVPDADYDSGWTTLAQDELHTFTHNLGGDPDDYLVSMQFKDSTYGVNQRHYGGDLYHDSVGDWVATGAYWRNLTNTEIKVKRSVNDNVADEVRIRIWKMPDEDYDSGWLSIGKDSNLQLDHDLNKPADDYVVDLQFKDLNDGFGVNQRSYGTDVDDITTGDSDYNWGAYWHSLTDTMIKVRREDDDPWADQVRVRIWNTQKCYTLDKSSFPGNGGTVTADPAPNCNGGTQYIDGTEVTLTATANAGYTFRIWSDSATDATTAVTMDSDQKVVAYFKSNSATLSDPIDIAITTELEEDPATTSCSEGNYMTVYEMGGEIYGRETDSAGSLLGDPFLVSDGWGNAANPDIACANGHYLAVWDYFWLGVSSNYHIRGQVILDDSNQNLVGPSAYISTLEPDNETNPKVACNQNDKECLVVFESYTQIDKKNIRAQRVQVDDTGFTLHEDIIDIANDDWGDEQPDVAWGSLDDNYLVVWSGPSNDYSRQGVLYNHVYDTYNAGDGDQLQHDNQWLTEDGTAQIYPAVAYGEEAQEYLVVFNYRYGDQDDVLAKRVSGTGTGGSGDVFSIADVTDIFEGYPAVAYNGGLSTVGGTDQFLVVYFSDSTKTTDRLLYGQRVSGRHVSGIQSSNSTSSQLIGSPETIEIASWIKDPDVAGNPLTGKFLAVWEWYEITIPDSNIYGRLVAPDPGQEPLQVLVDEAHDNQLSLDEARAREIEAATPWNDDWRWFSLNQLATNLSDTYLFSNDPDNPITYAQLQNYAALIVPHYSEAMTDNEVAAIQQFVHSGGGLILLGDCGYQSVGPPYLAAQFEMEFSPHCLFTDAPNLDGDVTITNFEAHPAVQGLTSFTMNWGSAVIPANGSQSAFTLATTPPDTWVDLNDDGEFHEDDDGFGEFPVVVGYDAGCGRVATVADNTFADAPLETWTQNDDLIRALLDWVTDGTVCEIADEQTLFLPVLIR